MVPVSRVRRATSELLSGLRPWRETSKPSIFSPKEATPHLVFRKTRSQRLLTAQIESPYSSPLIAAALRGRQKMVHNLLSAGAALSDLLRVLDALRTGKTSLKGPHSRPNEDDASQIFPSFQALEGWLYRPLDYSDGTELLNSSIIMTAQLSVFDAKLDSVAWEWRIPAAVRL